MLNTEIQKEIGKFFLTNTKRVEREELLKQLRNSYDISYTDIIEIKKCIIHYHPYNVDIHNKLQLKTSLYYKLYTNNKVFKKFIRKNIIKNTVPHYMYSLCETNGVGI